ncbi:MAG: BspA family leucine-rich repeat surface protein [Lachnospiraceae bacterium]|nr:BspA family leucine-rich repeat surface protein [Lachnospiraceae bacterium]
MKRQKLLNKRILALALSAAMVFAQADSYAVLAAAPEISGEEVGYDESQSVLTEDLEAEESGTEETDLSDDSTEAETTGGEGETTGGEGETTGGEGETTGGEGETTGGEGATPGGEGETTGGEGETTGGEGEENGTKQEVFISAVNIANKEYDGQAVSYTGSPVVKDSDENIITDVTISCSYTGTLANGSVYEKPTEAPSQAGSYTLTVTISESDKYTAEAVSCSFEITPKAITITAPSLSIKTGEALPELSSLTATIEGLLNGDTVQLQFKYGTNNISSKAEGTYDIIPYDADAGNNYSITYVNGTLTITKAEIVHEGASKDKKLTWTIDEVGKLTVKGIGNYPTIRNEESNETYIVPEWYQWKDTIKSAEVSVSGITSTAYMFGSCSKLESIDLTDLDTGMVKDMEGMFEGCASLTSLDLSCFDTSQVTNMSDMFYCPILTSLDLSSFDTGNVTNMNSMFAGCRSLTGLDLSGFDTGKVTDMEDMFLNCNSLIDLDISSFNTSKVKSMKSMFDNCSSLETLDLRSFNISSIKSMDYMFSCCRSLTSLDLSSFDMRSIKGDYDEEFGFYDYLELFFHCYSLSYIRTPKNCRIYVGLYNTSENPNVKWYDTSGEEYGELPTNLSTSIDIYKEGYPGDGNGTKRVVFISGINISSMVYNGQRAECSGTAVVMDSDKNKITDAILEYAYSGTLADGTPYVGTTAPSDVGKYKLVIKTESNDYSGQVSYSFRIKPRTVVISADSFSIEKGEKLPVLTNQYKVSGLLAGDELTVNPTLAYSEENISTDSSGRYAIIPSGASIGNNYSIKYEKGTLTVGDPDDDSSFEEEERTDLASLSCTIAPVKAKTYNGSAYEPALKVTVTENGKKKTLAEGADYRVLYEDNVNAGTAKVIIRGSGTYKGYKEASFTINPKAVKKLKVVTGGVAGSISADAVNNGSISLPVYVYDAGKLLTRGEDYTLTYDSLKKGTLTVKVKGVDGSNYTGEKKVKITVYEGASADKIINPENVNLNSYTAKYTGKAIKPAVEVNINGEVISNKNYKVQYQNNKNAGTAYVIVSGKGAYKGKVVTAFEITANTQRLFITNTIKTQTYKGKYVKPSVTVKAGNKKLKKNTDYVVTYKNNLHAGTATVTVTGKGNYTGTAVTTFTINPLKASKISVKGTWKDTNADGVKDGGALTVTYGKRLLKEGVDYTLEAGEIKKNKIKITLSAAEGSDFTGSVVKTLKIG